MAAGNPDIRPVDVHIDEALTNLAVDWPSPRLIGELITPFTQVDKQSNKYYVFDRANERITNAKRGLSDKSRSVEWGLSTDSYFIDDYALNHPLPDKTRQNADAGAAPVFSNERRARILKADVMLNHESELHTLMATSGNYASGLYSDLDSGTANFDDSGVDGLDTILALIESIENASGMRPDTAVISNDTWRKLKRDPSFFAVASQDVVITPQTFADLIEIPRIIIAPTIYNTAKKGQQPSLGRLWTGNSIWLLTTAPEMEQAENLPTTFKTFTTNLLPGYNNGMRVRTYRDEVSGGGVEFLEFERCWDTKIVGKDEAGKIITGAWLKNVYDAL